MLERTFKYTGNISKAIDLAVKYDASWSNAKHRFLYIAQHVFMDDIKNNEILSNKEHLDSFKSFLKQARNIARQHVDTLPEFSYAIINYNAYKTAGLTADQKHEADTEFCARAIHLIKEMQPTHVFISGTSAPNYILKHEFPDLDHIEYKRGWIFEKDGVKYCASIDVFKVLADAAVADDKYTGTVGFAYQHCANLMIGKHPYSLANFKPRAKYIYTLEEFDSMMRILRSSKCIGCDTETKNLTVLSNKIYTIQFSSDKEPELGYVLAIDHPQTHWNKEQLVYIKRTLQKFFYESGKPFLITYNGMFDLRVIRQALHLPVINREVWELMAGEHDLDENVNDLTQVCAVPQGNLRACLCRYNNDFYFRNAFTKEDRNTIGDIKPDDKDFLMYGAADAAFMQAILRMQLKRAEHTLIGDISYKPYFTAHMLNIMSPTAHTLSHLKEDGSYIDMNYMRTLRSPKISPLSQKITVAEQELFAFAEVQKANDLVMEREGFKANSLFGSLKKQWMFKFSKPEHKQALFFDIMKLKPVNISKKTGVPAVDKDFQNAYKHSNAIVSLYTDFTALAKLLNTYIKGWARMLSFKDPDAMIDHRLRPDYAFYNVKTGRLGSRNPSLQVIPQRGESADDIKRAFIAQDGHILFHYDYSAQEIRVWGISAHDQAIADTFGIGQKLRQLYIQDPTPENKKRIADEGDVHLLNVQRFFKKKVDKKHPLRAAVKTLIFGVIYAMGPQSLAEQLKGADITAAKKAIHDAWLKVEELKKTGTKQDLATAQKELNKANKALQTIMDEDRTQLAIDMSSKMFKEFSNGKAWLDSAMETAENYGMVMSPVGRIRHVPQVFIGGHSTKTRSIRQCCNAPIQGFASELAVKASRMILQSYYSDFKKICKLLGIERKIWPNRVYVQRIVHDANYYSIPYEFVLPFLHIVQYEATFGVANKIFEEFGLKFNIEPEIELELGTCDSDENIVWDWSIPNLVKILYNSLKTGHERGYVSEDPKSAMEKILKPWRIKECRDYLQDRYPLYNVRTLDKNIEDALKLYDEEIINT